METKTKYFTEAQAADEALLLFIRKTRRLHPEAFGQVWAKLPEGAKRALHAAEMRADVLRDDKSTERTWTPEPDLDEE